MTTYDTVVLPGNTVLYDLPPEKYGMDYFSSYYGYQEYLCRIVNSK